MERFIVIVLSALTGVAVYFWCVLALRNESSQDYVRDRTYLHPNAICYWRTAFALLGYYLYFYAHFESLAILIFTHAAIWDGLDGLVARKCTLGSKFGESLDPLCDKLTYLPPLFNFSLMGIMSTELVVILVAIEFLGQFFARKILTHFRHSAAANNFGKIKAIICFALIIYASLLDEVPGLINMCDEILIGCIALSIASIVFKFIPNRLYADILSGLNFCCGVSSLFFASSGHIVWAIIAIIIGQIFDVFDGRMAEKHGGTVAGPYLDDIADFVSFGICPAYIITLSNVHYSLALGSLFAFGVAYRLVRFVAIDKKKNDLPSGVFNGLPSPAGALIVIGSALVLDPIWLSIVTLISIGLMVSHINFAHFRKVIIKKLPKPVFFVLGAMLIVALSYVIKSKDAVMFGYLIMSTTTAYMLIGRIMATNAIRPNLLLPRKT